MTHFTPHTLPMQFCYQFYACVLLLGVMGGVSLVAVAMMTLYGIGGIELVFTLCFICVYGLLRLLLPPAHNNSFFPSSVDEDDGKPLALDTYTLEDNEEVIGTCSCCIWSLIQYTKA